MGDIFCNWSGRRDYLNLGKIIKQALFYFARLLLSLIKIEDVCTRCKIIKQALFYFARLLLSLPH